MVGMAYRGANVSNQASFIVEDYFNKKMLKELGYSFDFNALEQWEVEAYSIIANEVAKLREREYKSQRK